MASEDQSDTLFGKLDGSDAYPETIILGCERNKIVQSYREHFEEHQHKFFDEPEHAVLNLMVRDYGDEERPEQLRKSDKHEKEVIAKGKGVVAFRHFTLDDSALVRDRIAWRSREAPAPDPKSRFILFNTTNADSQVLCLNREMMFLLFTYHQVNPWYLHSITCLNSTTGASDLRFGGFRSQACLRARAPALHALGRSGCHYQLSFRFQSVQRREWRMHAAAVYHQFDVLTGKALWFLTSPLELGPDDLEHNHLWDAVRDCINQPRGHGRRLVSDHAHERFESSLHVLLAIAEWSVGDCGLYVHDLQQKIEHYRTAYVSPINLGRLMKDANRIGDDLGSIAEVIEGCQSLRIRLGDNKRVLEAMRSFYSEELLGDLYHPEVGLSWSIEADRHITALAGQLVLIGSQIEELIKRVSMLEDMGRRTETLIQRLIQNSQNREMRKIAEYTKNDSSAMKTFSSITLILLPMTVVSTVLSTDIVKFQGPADDERGPADGGFHFSLAAFLTWLIAGFVLTFVCLGFARKAWLSVPVTVALRELLHPPSPRRGGGGSSLADSSELYTSGEDHSVGSEGLRKRPTALGLVTSREAAKGTGRNFGPPRTPKHQSPPSPDPTVATNQLSPTTLVNSSPPVSPTFLRSIGQLGRSRHGASTAGGDSPVIDQDGSVTAPEQSGGGRESTSRRSSRVVQWLMSLGQRREEELPVRNSPV